MITAKDKIEALKVARSKADKIEFFFICHALPITPAGNKLRTFISNELGGHTSLASWIEENQLGTPTDPASMRQHRLAWIDWMIASLESQP